MKIDLLDDSPVVYRPYRLSYSERNQVREIVNELLQNDIIQESNSNYASPILMVKKKRVNNAYVLIIEPLIIKLQKIVFHYRSLMIS
ncbi:unnamed protein product [Euphydryas editha]|uniref:Reverse transcriptase n=1 Tax=Euphydryas editha TaxID=104508 RepID=A0AAU9U4T5_EUPED|nr:unnamed protein product [Euphydryas editha]